MIAHSDNELIGVLGRNLLPFFMASLYIFHVFRQIKTSKNDSAFGTTEPCEHGTTHKIITFYTSGTQASTLCCHSEKYIERVKFLTAAIQNLFH